MKIAELQRRQFLIALAAGAASFLGFSSRAGEYKKFAIALESIITLPLGQKAYLATRESWMNVPALRKLRLEFVTGGKMSDFIFHEISDTHHRSVYYFRSHQAAEEWSAAVERLGMRQAAVANGYQVSRQIQARRDSDSLNSLAFVETFAG